MHQFHIRWIERSCYGLFAAGLISISMPPAIAGQQAAQLNIHWDKTTVVLNTEATLQVVVNPPLRDGEPLSEAAYKAVKELGADYVRYVPWMPYPKLAVAEIEPPMEGKARWDFSLIDPMMKDFLTATAGHATVMNFSTIPQWMFVTEKPVAYPSDPNQVVWDYTQGTELRDPSGKELGDYYARLVSWYVNGGFTDESGVRHESGYHYKLPIWEVLNEPEYEHAMTPEQYTARYDAIVEGIQRVSPETKFMGLALAEPRMRPQFFEYFLNPANHKPGIPIDYISYHFYAVPTGSQTLEDWQYTYFDQADGFINTVRFVENIRKRLSPKTKTDLDELGVILADESKIPAEHWNLSGALFAYLYMEIAKQQIEIAGESQLVGYPTQFPSVSMMDWTTNKPNARFWVLKLIHDSFHPGEWMVETSINLTDVAAQGIVTAGGRKVMLVNKRNRVIDVQIPDGSHASALTVDKQSGEEPARSVKPGAGGILRLEPFSVTVVSW
jgi:hypothetical protein